jgi:hypothetical protein
MNTLLKRTANTMGVSPTSPDMTATLRRYPFSVIALVTAVILAWRVPDLLTNPQFWAEDGGVFFAQQFGHAWPEVFTPYWGYLLFVPRAIAWLVGFFKVIHAPFFYALLGLIVDALCISYVTYRSKNMFAPLIVWLSFVLVPSDGFFYGYIANIQWFSQFVLITCLFPQERPITGKSKRQLAAYAIFAMCALTGPFSALVAALAITMMLCGLLSSTSFPLKRLWQACERYSSRLPKGRLLVVGICALAQIATAATSPIGEHLSRPTAKVWMNAVSLWPQIHMFGTIFIPAAAFLFLIAAGVVALLRSAALTSDQKIVCVLMLGMAICELCLGVLKPGAIGPSMMGGDRYYFLGKTAAWWVIGLLALPYLAKPAQSTWMVAGAMLWVAFMNVDYMRRPPLPDLDWHKQAKQIQAGERTPLQINPFWWGNGRIVITPPPRKGEP